MPGRTQDSASTGGTAVHAGPSDGWGRDPEDARLERCAIEVPLDYDDPDGERITLAVTRIRALDPARRRGVLVGLNGGPGGNQGLGRFMPLRLADTPVHEVYDLIGFPRGWGASAPLMREVVQGKAPWSSVPRTRSSRSSPRTCGGGPPAARTAGAHHHPQRGPRSRPDPPHAR
ncbi:hypothetical protein [Streptomyces sp. MNU103]|uniref:hypothetical protein n=1 Tax=Streptomyces sp. MNU103 TaxID=2560024 RepID=UPI001E45EAB7|nr:hypothetical protein [Streptomyces sp. MNU103]